MGGALTDGRAATWLVVLVLLAFPSVGLLAKHGMTSGAIALAVLLMAMAAVRYRGWRSMGWPVRWPGWDLAAPLFVLMAVYLLDLAIAPACPPCGARWPEAAGAILILLPLAAGGLVSTCGVDRQRAGGALVAGVVIAALLAAVELQFDAPVYRLLDGRADGSFVSLSRFNRGLVALVMLAVAGSAWLWVRDRRWRAGGLLVLVAAVVALGDSLTAQLCVAVAVAALAVSAVAGRLARAALVVVLAGLMLGAPWVAPAAYDQVVTRNLDMDPAIRHRLELWDHGAALARERPWLGWGIDAFDHLPIAPERLDRAIRMTKPEPHPHNAGLQLWIEGGIVGVLLGLAWVVAIVLRIERMTPRLRPWATALLAVGLLPGMVAFGIWQATYLAMAALAVFALSLVTEKRV